MEGYGRFWVLIEIMRATNGHKISEKKYELEALAEEMKCSVEDLKKFLKDCVEEFELFIKEDGFYYSESLLERLAKLESLKAARQRGAYAMHQKLGHNITQDPNEPENL
jgi:hypothetical protein